MSLAILRTFRVADGVKGDILAKSYRVAPTLSLHAFRILWYLAISAMFKPYQIWDG